MIRINVDRSYFLPLFPRRLNLAVTITVLRSVSIVLDFVKQGRQQRQGSFLLQINLDHCPWYSADDHDPSRTTVLRPRDRHPDNSVEGELVEHDGRLSCQIDRGGCSRVAQSNEGGTQRHDAIPTPAR